MKRAAPVVSVVAPVYNGEQFLDECLSSILQQTYPDWELIVADNMSTDASAAIADRFAAQDQRIRVVRATDFVDIYTNHNRAMRLIDPGSRYCKVVHADDWLYPECLERMVGVAERRPAVGVVGAFRLVGAAAVVKSPLPYAQAVMPGRQFVRWELNDQAIITGSPTSVLLRADIVRQREDFYDVNVWHADTDAVYRVLLESDFGFVHQILTYTRMHPGALSPFSYRVWSFIVRDGLLLLRYGPHVFTPSEYRAARTVWLWRYGAWLARQMLKPSRHRQKEFYDFHQRGIDAILAEVGDDRQMRLVLSMYRGLLRSTGRSAPTLA